MYVSTAYSNAHLKKYSTVKEQLYPLREQDGQEVDHAAIVNRLLAMPVEEAQSEVALRYYLHDLHYPHVCMVLTVKVSLATSCLNSSTLSTQSIKLSGHLPRLSLP